MQIEHAHLDEDDPRREDLAEREKALLQAHGQSWCDPLPEWVRQGPCWFRRGFVAEVTLTADQFLVNGEELRRLAPLDGIALRLAVRHMKAIARCPALAALVHLELTDWEHRLGPDDIQELALSPHLSALRTLDLTGQWIGNAGVQAIANAASLGPLRALYLEHNFMQLSEAPTGREFLDVQCLLDSPHADHLTALYLSNNRMRQEAIAAVGGFPRLRALTLSRVEPAGAKALARSPNLISCAALSLFGGPGGWRRSRRCSARRT